MKVLQLTVLTQLTVLLSVCQHVDCCHEVREGIRVNNLLHLSFEVVGLFLVS